MEDLDLLEEIILDYEGIYIAQERIVAIKGYVTIEGWNEKVLEEALALADNPVEAEVLKAAIDERPFSSILNGKF